MKTKKTSDRISDVYQIVTDRVIELLRAGTVPWRQPWTVDNTGRPMMPTNLKSGKAYRGVNVFLLAGRYTSPYWLTYGQAVDLGGNVRKGEKSTLVVFWKWLDKEDKTTGETKRIPMLRYYNVFNVEQCDGIKLPKHAQPKPAAKGKKFNPIAEAVKIVDGYKGAPAIVHNEARAFYRRTDDIVNMPKPETFDTEANYYNVLFHELTHSTGHDSRLGRLQNSTSGFGSGSYAKEELVGEMGAAFLSAMAGISDTTIVSSAAYIKSWLGRLQDDPKLVVQAAGAAQKSCDHILGTEFEPQPEE